MSEERPSLFSAAWAASAVGGVVEGLREARVGSVVVDSRKATEGSLFVALPGERTDGHAFVTAALRSGASCVIARADRRAALDREALGLAEGRAAMIFVPDALAALQALAAAYRRRFPRLRRLGITGSSGKTTTKECAAAILGRSHSIVINPGNLNSDIGLPLSVFAIGEGHEVGVFEMGMNRAGEMGELATVFEPDVAVITNVGTAHIGILGSRDAIAAEKKKIFSRFDGRQVGFVWEKDEYNSFLKDGVPGRILDFGIESTSGLRVARNRGLGGWDLEWKGRGFAFALPGAHNLLDAVAALAAATAAGASDDDAVAGLSAVRSLFGRSEILEGAFTIVRDCYNANPDSVKAAIALCDSVPRQGRRAYVLGSMLELGRDSDAAHGRIGEIAGNSRADALFFFGDETRPAFEAARLAGFPGLALFETDFDRLLSALKAYLAPGDLVLLKASRGVELERVSEALMPAAGPPNPAAVDAQRERGGE